MDMMFAGDGAEQAKQGSVRALAVTDSQRSKSAPDIPTMAEAGVKNYALTIWFGFVAPAGTPRPIVDRLSADIGKTLDDLSKRQLASVQPILQAFRVCLWV